MKCPNCGEEIVLAKICPYCGQKVSETTKENKRTEQVHGKFRGPLRERNFSSRSASVVSVWQYLRATVMFLKDPKVRVVQKLLVVFAVLYLVYPFDVIPDLFFGLGWLDDATVIALAWRYLSDQLTKYLS